MSKVITVLETMASDAAMNSESAIADLIANSNINNSQQQAILANDVEALVKNTIGLPTIRAFVPIIVADDEEQGNIVANKQAANF